MAAEMSEGGEDLYYVPYKWLVHHIKDQKAKGTLTVESYKPGGE